MWAFFSINETNICSINCAPNQSINQSCARLLHSLRCNKKTVHMKCFSLMVALHCIASLLAFHEVLAFVWITEVRKSVWKQIRMLKSTHTEARRNHWEHHRSNSNHIPPAIAIILCFQLNESQKSFWETAWWFYFCLLSPSRLDCIFRCNCNCILSVESQVVANINQIVFHNCDLLTN